MEAPKPKCFKCGELLDPAFTGRRDECSGCRADVHVCKNCQHYDSAVYNECREPQADRVLEKDRSNFCDYFKLGGAGQSAAESRDAARAALDALFKK